MKKLKLRQVRLLAKRYITSRQPKIQAHVCRTLSPVKIGLSEGEVARGTPSVMYNVAYELTLPFPERKFCFKSLKVFDSTKRKKVQKRGQ